MFLNCKFCKRVGRFCKQVFTISLAVLTLAMPTLAEAEFSVLIVGKKSDRPTMLALQLRCEELRNRLRIRPEEMPIRVHVADERDLWSRRLGLERRWHPALGVALWNKKATLGPRRFVGDSFVKNATQHHALRVVQSFLKVSEHKSKALPPFHSADSLPIPTLDILAVESVRFEASGKPNDLTNFAVRLRNDSLETVRDIKVEFFVRRSPAENWRQCAVKKVAKVASHHMATAEFVAKTKELGLLDSNGNAVACRYKVEISLEGREPLVEVGAFQPSERPVD